MCAANIAPNSLFLYFSPPSAPLFCVCDSRVCVSVSCAACVLSLYVNFVNYYQDQHHTCVRQNPGPWHSRRQGREGSAGGRVHVALSWRQGVSGGLILTCVGE